MVGAVVFFICLSLSQYMKYAGLFCDHCGASGGYLFCLLLFIFRLRFLMLFIL